MSIEFGYCTNVHPGISLQQIERQLLDHAVEVRRLRGDREPLWLGLWFGETASRELSQPDALSRFADFLREHGLRVRTLNGFPAGDFHQPVVKRSVYEPSWADKSRLDYTCRLIDLLIGLLGDQSTGTISTLPLGWPSSKNQGYAFNDACGEHLLAAARYARQRGLETGKQVRLCLEPEPGCSLATSSDVVEFFTDYLFSIEPDLTADYLGVCHDICHAVVMRESQQEALSAYRANEIPIGKVQVSAALLADFSGSPAVSAELVAKQLAEFAEPRYLHQTMAGGRLYEDLPEALAVADRAGQWRVHFHLPIFIESLAPGISASQREIATCWNYLNNYRGVGGGPNSVRRIDWEVETYAWGVLPEAWRPATLAEGIANELDWFQRLVSS